MTPNRFARLLMGKMKNNETCGNCKSCSCCKNCSCSSPLEITEPSGMDMDYLEVDSSPLASQTIKFFEELEAKKAATGRNFWDTYCELNSSDPECKVFDI